MKVDGAPREYAGICQGEWSDDDAHVRDSLTFMLQAVGDSNAAPFSVQPTLEALYPMVSS